MTDSSFWKCAAIAFIAATFHLGHGLHQSAEPEFPRLLATAGADEPESAGYPIRWLALDRSASMVPTYRTKVEGGWLVMARNEVKQQFGLTFVPDADHSWRVAE